MRGIDTIPIGSSVSLLSIRALAIEFGTSLGLASEFLENLTIPVIRMENGDEYFNLYSLELVLFGLLAPGGQSLGLPGSYSNYLRKLPRDLVASLTDPRNPLHARCAVAGIANTYGGRRQVETRLATLVKVLLGDLPEGKLKREIKNGRKSGSKRRVPGTPTQGTKAPESLSDGTIKPRTL